MSKFESPIKEVAYSQERVYNKLSDLNNLEAIKDKLPQDKIQDLNFTSDTLSFSISPVGQIAIKAIEKTPSSCIKLQSETSPLPFTLWIQIVPLTEESCKIRVTIEASLNPFIKGMVQKPLTEGLDKMATVLSKIEY